MNFIACVHVTCSLVKSYAQITETTDETVFGTDFILTILYSLGGLSEVAKFNQLPDVVEKYSIAHMHTPLHSHNIYSCWYLRIIVTLYQGSPINIFEVPH